MLVGIVPAHLGDAALFYPHKLAAGDIQMPPLVCGRGMLHGDDELLPDRDIDQFSPDVWPDNGPSLARKSSRKAGQPWWSPAMGLLPGRCQVASGAKQA